MEPTVSVSIISHVTSCLGIQEEEEEEDEDEDEEEEERQTAYPMSVTSASHHADRMINFTQSII